MVLLCDLKNWLNFWRLPSVGVVDLRGIQALHLLLSDKAALVTVALLGEVLSAAIANLLLIAPSLFFQ